MHRRPRLVATDLDGTLLRSDGTVSAYTLDVLDRARESGVDVVAVTARSPIGIEAVAEDTGLIGTAIIGNGSMLYDLDARRLLSSTVISAAAARAAAEEARSVIPDAGFAVTNGLSMFADASYGAVTMLFHIRTVVAPDELWAAQDIVRLYMHSRSLDTDAMFERVAGLGSVWMHAGGESMLEFGAPGVTKASALRDLCDARGIAAADVAAFGDMPSDLEMLAWAGHPHAVANAHPLVLAAVSRRAPANDEDGVAKAVEGLLFGPPAA
ncbi:HAD family hydrolase [Phytomonospora sp. NPDC050363]|uniref:HAD family hydrolase n=1 Tax=Phytomonospora sp. NPDC050363 TaxID=3155642 RepID=UPI0033E71ACB